MSESNVIRAADHREHGNWLDGYMAEGRGLREAGLAQLIDVPAIRGMIVRQRWVIAVIMAAAFIAGLVCTMLAMPMYEARSSVRIDPYGADIVERQNLQQGIASNQVYDMIATQMGIIQSRAMAHAVAQDLDLVNRAAFLDADIDQERPPAMSDKDWAEAKLDMAAEMLQESVSAELPAENWIIEIAYRSEDPRLAAEIANGYLAAFARFETLQSLESNKYAQEFLQGQIATIREKLSDAERAANLYARNNNIIVQPLASNEEGAAPTLRTANLADINAQVSAAMAARIEAEQRWRAVQGLPASQLSEAQDNPLLQSMIADRARKQTELADLLQRYDSAFPAVQNLQAQIATLTKQIDRTSADIKAAIRNNYSIANRQEQALRAQLSAAMGATLAEQDSRVGYEVLGREAQSLRDQLKALLQRYNQVSAATNVDSGRIHPLDAAVVPQAPYSPSLLRNLALALVFGSALAGVVAVLRESLDDRLHSLDDVESRLGLPLLGHTPHVADDEIDHHGGNRFGELMESYASIRATVDFAMPRDRNVLQFTSSQEGEGKSTTALILAEISASLGRRTLLIDADLRRPSIASLLGIVRPKFGLAEVLLGQIDLTSALLRDTPANLDVLPVGAIPSNPTELLSSPQFADFIRLCSKEYALVIFDSAPVLGLADAPMLSRLVDATIFVMEANRVHFGQARAALRRLQAGGGNPIGGIVTKYRAAEAGEAYQYQPGYYGYGGVAKAA